jgi:hypothetical protein
VYSSEDVINALRNNASLTFQGIDMIKCPRHDVIDKGPVCVHKPDACDIGHKQKCKQHIHIFRNGALVRIIEFRFMRSVTDASGFIKRDDSVLKSLLRNNIISL